jgi:hypothetical protein
MPSDSGAQTTAQARVPDSWPAPAYWLASAQSLVAENINRFHPGCHKAADLRGGDCVAAAHRLCESSHSKNSFGFIFQRDAENVWVGCALRGWYGDVPYTRLQQLHPQCRGPADSQSPHCVAAVRRYCANERSLSGGLVQEVGPTSAAIACFEASRSSDVPYIQLARFSSGCKAPNTAGSLSCVTAAANWCKANDKSLLGLPQEIGPTSVAVACFATSVRVVRVLDRPGKIDHHP